MGKSEVVPMPIHRQDSLYAACKGAFNTVVHTVDEEQDEDEDDFGIPDNMQLFTNQVAGHTNDGKSYGKAPPRHVPQLTPKPKGMIKHNGTILKPITKQKCGDREIDFYEEINSATDKTRSELRDFVPKYYGKVTVPIKGNDVDCIVLEDLTRYYKEPCVIDIKIGRRTWDPTASYDKIVNEEVSSAIGGTE